MKRLIKKKSYKDCCSNRFYLTIKSDIILGGLSFSWKVLSYKKILIKYRDALGVDIELNKNRIIEHNQFSGKTLNSIEIKVPEPANFVKNLESLNYLKDLSQKEPSKLYPQ